MGNSRKEEPPPCVRTGGRLCRGCSGWQAMIQAARPGGPWQGVAVHCPCIDLTVSLGDED